MENRIGGGEDHLERLRGIVFGPRLALLPDAREALTALLHDLDAVKNADVIKDRKLLTINLWNVNNAAESVADARAASGAPSDFLDEAMDDLLTLIADMRQRAQSLASLSHQQIALHARVAARDAAQSAPISDMTRQFRIIAAAPIPKNNDSPGSLADTPVGVSKDDYGRVSGDVVMFERSASSPAAPVDCVVLPAGSVIHFAEGESFELFSEGHVAGGQFEAPQRAERSWLILEAGEGGCALYGPAVLRLTGLPPGALAALRLDIESVSAAWDPRRGLAYADNSWVFESAFMSAVAIMGVVTVAFAADRVLGMMALALAGVVVVVSAGLGIVSMVRTALLRRDIRVRENALIPPRVRSGEFSRRFIKITGYAGWERQYLVPSSEGLMSVAHSIHRAGEVVRRVSGVNAFPMRRVTVRRGEEPRVMEPLRALPAPVSAIAAEKHIPAA